MNWPIVVPKLGATGGDIEIIRWYVKVGDRVKAGQPLLEVSTDKANVEIEAFCDGLVREISATPGTKLEPGATIGLLADSMTGSASAHVTEPAQSAANTVESEPLVEMYRRMVLIRRFEDHLYRLFLQGLVPGTLHQCQGQEAVAVGVCMALRRDDWVFSTHRPVGHLLAKGSSAAGLAAEIWGKSTGCSGGKGGQMHLCDMSVSVPPSNAIVGANIPIATGTALAFALAGSDRVAVSFFGDGASNIGAFHEGINLAAVTNAPVVFVCENNLYGASTHQARVMKIEHIADRAAAYGIPGEIVDGMDVRAVHASALRAVERARQKQGPTLIECKTYRYLGHSRGDPQGYRSKEEVEQWRARDPIPALRRELVSGNAALESTLDRIEKECQVEVERAVEFAQKGPDPDPGSVLENVFASRERVRR